MFFYLRFKTTRAVRTYRSWLYSDRIPSDVFLLSMAAILSPERQNGFS